MKWWAVVKIVVQVALKIGRIRKALHVEDFLVAVDKYIKAIEEEKK